MYSFSLRRNYHYGKILNYHIYVLFITIDNFFFFLQHLYYVCEYCTHVKHGVTIIGLSKMVVEH